MESIEKQSTVSKDLNDALLDAPFKMEKRGSQLSLLDFDFPPPPMPTDDFSQAATTEAPSSFDDSNANISSDEADALPVDENVKSKSDYSMSIQPLNDKDKFDPKLQPFFLDSIDNSYVMKSPRAFSSCGSSVFDDWPLSPHQSMCVINEESKSHLEYQESEPVG